MRADLPAPPAPTTRMFGASSRPSIVSNNRQTATYYSPGGGGTPGRTYLALFDVCSPEIREQELTRNTGRDLSQENTTQCTHSGIIQCVSHCCAKSQINM